MPRRALIGGFAAGLVAVVLSVAAWWAFRGVEPPSREGGDRAAIVATPELARETLDRIERLRAGEGGPRLALGSPELTAVVLYGVPERVPSGLAITSVEVFDGELFVSMGVSVADFPDFPRLDDVVGLLPDTLAVATAGTVTPFDMRHTMLVVDRMEVAGVPLPRRSIPAVLSAVDRERLQGVPEDAVAVSIPSGIELVFIQGDSLVLLARTQDAGG